MRRRLPTNATLNYSFLYMNSILVLTIFHAAPREAIGSLSVMLPVLLFVFAFGYYAEHLFDVFVLTANVVQKNVNAGCGYAKKAKRNDISRRAACQVM